VWRSTGGPLCMHLPEVALRSLLQRGPVSRPKNMHDVELIFSGKGGIRISQYIEQRKTLKDEF